MLPPGFPQQPVHPAMMLPYNLDISKLANRPPIFTGTRRNPNDRIDVHSWIKSMETFLTITRVPNEIWVPVAFTFIQKQAFNTMTAQQEALMRQGKWNNTWSQFSELLVQLFADIEQQYALRTRLYELRMQDGDILKYARSFQSLATRIIDPPIAQVELLTLFLNGLDSFHYNINIIDPTSGKIWKDYYRLHDYILSKYVVIKYHKRKRDMIQDRDSRMQSGQPFKRRTSQQRFGRYSGKDRDNRRFRSDNRRPKRTRDYEDTQRRQKRFKTDYKDRFQGHNRYKDNSHRQRSDRNDGDKKYKDRDRKFNFKTTDPKQMTFGQPLSTAQKEMLMREHRCLYCFQTGHDKKHCPKKQ